MKPGYLPLLLAIAAGLANTVAQAATTGTLRFVGRVNSGTCNLAAGDANRTITLPTIKISDFGGNTHAGIHNFEISAECESDIRNVTFVFSGIADTGNGLLFSSTGTSGGTALWLSSRAPTATTIPANGTVVQRSRTIATASGKAVMPLKAAYHKTGAPITPGTLVSAVTVNITYN